MQALPVLPTAAVPTARVAEPPVRIGVYDGPLELLLFLVRREGVNVRDIPVARICDAYLAFLGNVDELDVDKAGDYLLMAATLCQLKVRELLPREVRADAGADDEEALDPKEALARRLLEYERYRSAAEELGARERLDRDVFSRPFEPTAPDEQPIDRVVDVFGLLRTFYAVLERAHRPPPVHEVHRERYSLLDTVKWILAKINGRTDVLLSELFSESPSRGRRIFTFLSVLEMARHQFLDLVQTAHLAEIRLTPKVTPDSADYRVISAQDDEDDEVALARARAANEDG